LQLSARQFRSHGTTRFSLFSGTQGEFSLFSRLAASAARAQPNSRGTAPRRSFPWLATVSVGTAAGRHSRCLRWNAAAFFSSTPGCFFFTALHSAQFFPSHDVDQPNYTGTLGFAYSNPRSNSVFFPSLHRRIGGNATRRNPSPLPLFFDFLCPPFSQRPAQPYAAILNRKNKAFPLPPYAHIPFGPSGSILFPFFSTRHPRLRCREPFFCRRIRARCGNFTATPALFFFPPGILWLLFFFLPFTVFVLGVEVSSLQLPRLTLNSGLLQNR